jgi:hypothetical protein
MLRHALDDRKLRKLEQTEQHETERVHPGGL